MMPCSAFSLLLFAPLAILGVSISKHDQTTARVSESLSPPSRWKKNNLAEDDVIIHLNIGLRNDGSEELERRLDEGIETHLNS